MVAKCLSIESKCKRGIAVQALGFLEADTPVGQDDAVRELTKRRRPSPVARARAFEHSLGGERHDTGVPVVRLHELLDAEGDSIDETELLGDVFLVAKGEPVLLAAGAQMQEVPDAPEHLAGVFELADLAGEKRTRSNVVLFVSSAPAGSGCPLGHIHVPQTASPLFHIGLQKIEAPSETAVSCLCILLERAEKLVQVRLEDLLPRATLELVEKRAAAGNSSEVDQRGGGSDVLASQIQSLFDASNRVTDIDPQVPDRVEQALGQRPDERIVRIVTEEHDVDVTIESQRRAAVATDGDECDTPLRFTAQGASGSIGSAVQGAKKAVEGSRVGAGRADTRVPTAHRVLERPAISTEVPTAGLAERRCEPT